MNVGISDKLLMPYLKKKLYMDCSNEGEAIGIAMGYYLATGKRGTVFMSADGFCNALNAITSEVIPKKIKMDIVISTGRLEEQHKVMSEILGDLIGMLPYDSKNLHFKFVQKKS